MTEKYRPRSDNKIVIQSPCKPWTLRVEKGSRTEIDTNSNFLTQRVPLQF